MPGLTTNYTMYIGGSPVQIVQGSLDVVNQIGQRSTGTVKVVSALNTFWQQGTQVQVYNTTPALVYAGFVSKDEVTKASQARLWSPRAYHHPHGQLLQSRQASLLRELPQCVSRHDCAGSLLPGAGS